MAGGTDMENAPTLPGRILGALRRHGDATVARWKRYGLWQPVSGRHMAERIEAIANGLRAQGFAAGDVAAVIGDNCHEWVLADVAIGAAGGVSAGLDPHCDANELARIVNQCQARVLFVSGDDQLHRALQAREHCPGLQRIVTVHQQWDDGAGDAGVTSLASLEAAAKADGALSSRSADDPAVIIYSSGSTGRPRGALLSHRAIILQADLAKRSLGLRNDDERLSLTPLHHVLERVVGIYAALLAGTVVNFPESRDTALADLSELQPTVVQASPQLFAKLRAGILLTMADTTTFQRWACRTALALEAKQSPLRKLTDAVILGAVRSRIGLQRARLCLSCGAAIQPDLSDWFAAFGRPLTEVYGLAETGGAVRIASDHAFDWKLADDGELWLRGDGLFLGYAGGEAREPADDGWWRSGDFAQADGNGGFGVRGRLAHALYRDDARVLPFDSEHALKASPYIADAFVHLGRGGGLRARILLDSDHIVRYAQDRGIPFTHFQSLCRAKEIRYLVAQLIAEVNGRHAAIQIDSFSLIERALRPGDHELSPSLTLRRQMLIEDSADAAADRTAAGEPAYQAD